MKSYFVLLLIVLSIAFVLTSCRFADVVHYEHQPSQRFYKTKSIGEADKSFIHEEVLFVIDAKAINNRENFIFWLGLYSNKKDQRVEIDRVIVHGLLEKKIAFDTSIRISGETSVGGLFNGSVKLFELSEYSLKKIYDSGMRLTIDVFFNENSKVVFNIDRKVLKLPVFST